MESIGTIAQELSEKFGIETPKTPEEDAAFTLKAMQDIAEITNRQWGRLDKYDGYNCPKCKNRGEFMVVLHTKDLRDKNGNPYPFNYPFTTMQECECKQKRLSYERSRASGLPEGYEMSNFYARNDWQKRMKEMAQNYMQAKAWRDGKWVYVGGAVGSGKTHLVTALARELVYERDVRYFNWVRDGEMLKRLKVDGNSQMYANYIDVFVHVDVLFIDDFLHGRYTSDADLKLAYDILNDRYLNRLPTLFTSELLLSEISDESISSRIYERAGEYNIAIKRGDSKNQRYSKGA